LFETLKCHNSNNSEKKNINWIVSETVEATGISVEGKMSVQ